MEIQNLINCIENNGLHYITCRLQMTWGQSDKVELIEVIRLGILNGDLTDNASNRSLKFPLTPPAIEL